MRIINQLTNPIKMPFCWQDFLFAIPGITCGFLLSSNFGAAKFGLSWSPPENNLGLFEVAFWFPNDVSVVWWNICCRSSFFCLDGCF
ncbi:hypothetical protein [Flavobacterium sp.]|uniref:hypothetical protein n=1 Tax=Flavobacterium sp. TaxID=239 RepID=UPI0025EDB5F5|nr:hypothetical protein [Flavobacterium sp.]